MAHVWGIESEFVDAESEMWLLLYAANVSAPILIARVLAKIKANCEMFEQLDGQQQYAGKRFWFESVLGVDAHGVEHRTWTSLQPGEHRLSRPAGDKDHIVCVDPPPMHAALRRCLRDGFAAVSAPSIKLTTAYLGLRRRIDESFPIRCVGHAASRLKSLVGLGASSAVARRFHCAALAMRQSHEPEKILNARYEDLVRMACDHSHFASAMALLTLQANLGQYIEQNVYASPAATIAAARELIARATTAKPAATMLNEVGTMALTFGNASVKNALNALSPVEFGFWLYDALGHFWVAHWNATVLGGSKKANLCAYDAMEAEEGFACVQTGLGGAFSSLVDAWVSSDRIDALIARGDITEAEKWVTCDSAMLNPLRPRYLGKYLFADALIRSRDRALCIRAREMLRETLKKFQDATLDHRYNRARDIEVCRIELALARAHHELNEFDEKQALLSRVSGRMVVSSVLGEQRTVR